MNWDLIQYVQCADWVTHGATKIVLSPDSGRKGSQSVICNQYQSSLGQLGDETEPSNHTSEACEAFACAVYTAVTVAGTKVNDVRYWMFCQKGHGNVYLPPTSDTLQ